LVRTVLDGVPRASTASRAASNSEAACSIWSMAAANEAALVLHPFSPIAFVTHGM
jgi:hypothetical protein